MIKCKKIVKKWLFDGFGHVGKMDIFEEKIQKKQQNFDIMTAAWAQNYPKNVL